MARILRVVAFCLITSLALGVRLEAQTLSKAEQGVWRSVEERWRLWKDNDLEGLLARHHPKFRRLHPRYPGLQQREELLPYWREIKRWETLLSYRLELSAVDVFDDFAVAHYVSHETVRRTAEAPALQGQAFTAPIRWSDYMVREKGRWLLLGGARDLLCSVFERSRNPCQQRPSAEPKR